METTMQEMLAPCGLDCAKCAIWRAPREPETMKRLIEWFKNERKIDLGPEQVRCGGCLGDRSIHWSADCEILKCAVDERGLRSCSDCGDFPCERLTAWARGGEKYAEALERLKRKKEEKH